MSQMFLAQPSSMSKEEFLNAFGRIYEHSPWVAEGVWAKGVGPQHDAVETLHRAMMAVVDEAPRERRLALLNAHPDLAGRLAMRGGLTAESTGEQAGAGLDKCTPEEFARFNALNAAYYRRFGFPFIMAVKGRSRAEILSAFDVRVHSDPGSEFSTAIAEVHKIAYFRLQEL